MKQLLYLFILTLIALFVLNQALPADAAKKTVKKKGMSQETLLEISEGVDNLTKKIYSREFYTPEDAQNLITLKLKLDTQMDILSETSFAPLYFKLGNIFRLRGEEKDAIICYQTILENFSDTAYGPKARDILAEMGIEIKLPSENEGEDEFN